jgi:Tfp pilus assembly major pilin PilA
MPLAVLVGVWFYYALMESSGQQATLGKRAVGIKVTDLEGNQISFGRATGRLAAHILSGVILGIGFAMAAFTSRRQTLHDKIAGTLVVKREWTEEEVAAAGAAPPVPAWASALVVLAVVLFGPFGIGMIAAISIPAYQAYTIRAQVMDGLSDAEPYKAAFPTNISQSPAAGPADSVMCEHAAPPPPPLQRTALADASIVDRKALRVCASPGPISDFRSDPVTYTASWH